MTDKEKLIYLKLDDEKKILDARKELKSIGAKDEILNDSKFNEFADKFAGSKFSMKEIYEMYMKENKPKEEATPIGSMKNPNPKEKKTRKHKRGIPGRILCLVLCICLVVPMMALTGCQQNYDQLKKETVPCASVTTSPVKYSYITLTSSFVMSLNSHAGLALVSCTSPLSRISSISPCWNFTVYLPSLLNGTVSFFSWS